MIQIKAFISSKKLTLDIVIWKFRQRGSATADIILCANALFGRFTANHLLADLFQTPAQANPCGIKKQSLGMCRYQRLLFSLLEGENPSNQIQLIICT